jgi:hypothetical protein
MGINNKYTIEERNIVRKIWQTKRQQQVLYASWHRLDIRLNLYRHELAKVQGMNQRPQHGPRKKEKAPKGA